MAVNLHQPSVYAIFDATPMPLLTFAVSGQVTFANQAAKQHPGRPVETMSGNPTIKSLLAAATLGKLKLPYSAKIELAEGHHLAGQFMPGPAGLDIAFMAQEDASSKSANTSNMTLNNIVELLRDELVPPMQLLSRELKALPANGAGSPLDKAVHALNLRLTRFADLVRVFGNEVLNLDDRIEPLLLIRQICESLDERARNAGVHFEIIDPQQTLPPIYGNLHLITRAFHECLENALVHSRQEIDSGQRLSVEIRFTQSGEHIMVGIRNRGASTLKVSSQEMLRLFASPAPGSNESVARLGLPLVQRIVGLHGGNMRLNSVDQDTVQVLLEFPTGAPRRGQHDMGMTQAQRYAQDLAQLMSRRKKEAT